MDKDDRNDEVADGMVENVERGLHGNGDTVLTESLDNDVVEHDSMVGIEYEILTYLDNMYSLYEFGSFGIALNIIMERNYAISTTNKCVQDNKTRQDKTR